MPRMQQISHDEETPEQRLREFRFAYSPQLPQILEHLNASVLVTTYQAGKLLVLGVKEDKLNISFLDYEQPMGLAVSSSRIAIGTRRQVHFLLPAHETQANQDFYNGCFVPRSTHYTGSIHGHDLAWGQDGLWIVNTLFSCLCTLHDDYSFVPHWRPPFISQLIDQDRCHLNGLALENGRPKYVTAMSETDSPAGWRPNKVASGVIIDVPSGEAVCRQLSMPHSPRIANGQLWVLDSGRGALCRVDPATGRRDVVENLPGYTRGLSFAGQFAFVGLSKIRETSVFGGVPIAENRDALRCGVGVVDLISGKTVGVFQFHSGVSEIFAVDVLPGVSNPLVAGASFDQQEREVWIVPNEHTWPQNRPRLAVFAGKSFTSLTHLSKSELTKRVSHLHSEGRLDEAAIVLQEAISTSETASLLVDLGNLRQDQANQQSARLCYERALELDPLCLPALQNLGYLLFNLGEAEKAQDIYGQLLRLAPSTLNHLLASSVLPVVYDSQADIAIWRDRQLQLLCGARSRPEKVDATKSLVPTCFFAAYQGLCDRELMEQRAQVIQGRDFTLGRRRINSQVDIRRRIGVLSAYFRDHTIGRLNIARFEQLKRDQLELIVIYAGREVDEMTKRFAATADRFVQLPRTLPLAIDSLAALNLDILLHTDVGMDALTQTLAYSRFAPIQLATWGHPDTTGSPVMDYFLSSEGLEAEFAQDFYSEKLVKLPSLGIDYERPHLRDNPKSRIQLGLPEGNHLYACPQTLFKIHPDFDSILAQILESDTDGEVVMLEGRIPEWTHRIRRRFHRTLPEYGKRVRFLPALSRQDFLSLLASVDVVLDPVHFGGGNSSLEALAIGVPVITLRGKFLRSRITSTIYEQMKFLDLVADSSQQYANLALRVANNPDYAAEMRQLIQEAAVKIFTNQSAAKEFEDFLLCVEPVECK